MNKFNKFWVAALGAVAIGLNEGGVFGAQEAEALVTGGAAILSACAITGTG